MIPVGKIGDAGKWEYTRAYSEISGCNSSKDPSRARVEAMKKMLDLRPDLREKANALHDPRNVFRVSRLEDVSSTIQMLAVEQKNRFITKLKSKLPGKWWP